MKNNKHQQPKISVLMTVYKGEEYIKEAIESILNQTYKNFEFIIVNDSSPDDCQKIIDSFKDDRIITLNNEKNIGLVSSLNKGIAIATGKYIARMDQDDISLPKRLAIQVAHMESNPNIGICGSNVKTIGKISGYINKKLTHPEENKAILLFHTPFAHPTVMIRKKILEENNLLYDVNFEYCEDYNLWTRISKVTKMSNIDQVLLLYRTHETNMSQLFGSTQSGKAKILKKELIENTLKIKPSEKDFSIHNKIKTKGGTKINTFLIKKEKWLKKLILQNHKIKYYQEPYFSNVISKQWLMACYSNINKFESWKIFWKSDFSKKIPHQELMQLFKFFIKCLFNKK